MAGRKERAGRQEKAISITEYGEELAAGGSLVLEHKDVSVARLNETENNGNIYSTFATPNEFTHNDQGGGRSATTTVIPEPGSDPRGTAT